MTHSRNVLLTVVALGLSILGGCATHDTNSPNIGALPKVLARSAVRVVSVIEAVDRDNNIVTLRHPDGKLRALAMTASDIERARRGDYLATEYLDEFTIYADSPDANKNDDRVIMKASAPGATVETKQYLANVADIDYENRLLSLRTPSGRVQTVRVAPDIGAIDRLSKGDDIVIRYTRMIAVVITKTAPDGTSLANNGDSHGRTVNE